MAELSHQLPAPKTVKPITGIAIILVSLLFFSGVGVLVGKLFFWDQYKTVSRADAVLEQNLEQVKADPKNPNKLANLGWAYFQKQDYERAIATYKEVLKYDNNHFAANANLGLAYLSQGKYDRAEDYLKQALKISPKSDMVHTNLGLVYIKKGEYKEAKQELDLAYRINPGSADILYYLGMTSEKLGNLDEAKYMYSEALSLDPKFSKASEALAKLGKDAK